MNARDEAKDLQVDWALREQLGAEQPPDLTEAVLERLDQDAGDPMAMQVAHPRNRRWLAAALVLLGIGAVLGAALWPRGEKGGEQAPAQAPQDPALKATEIANVADVAALPMDTRAIEAQAIGDEVLAALASRAGRGELPKLESLTVVNPAHQTYGLGLKMQLPPGEQSITAAGVKHIAALSKLRRLVLSGTFALRKGLAKGAPLLEDLVRLPMLSDLTIRFVDTSDADLAVLPRLAALERLDLSFNHGFGGPAIDAIVRCVGLTTLSLRGCQQLQGAMLARLGGLPRLEWLDLGLIDGINWRNVPDEARFIDEVELGVLRRAVGRAGGAANDDAMVGIASAKNLRWLDISGGHCRDRGYAALGELPRLEVLDMSGVQARPGFITSLPRSLRELHVSGDYDDAFCASVRDHLTELRHLDVSACYQITDTGVASLVTLPRLRVLELRQCRGLTPGCIDVLVKARQIEELDLRHVDWVTAEHDNALSAGMASLRVLETSVDSERDAPGARAIIKRLQQTVMEHDFASATMKDWATFYCTITGVPFIMSREVRQLDAASTTLTDFKLPRMSVADALNAIESRTGVMWKVKNGVVLLVPRSPK